jgi:hypothetical protein
MSLKSSLLFVAVCLFTTLQTGCFSTQPSIDQIIASLEQSKSAVVSSTSQFSDYKVYRDGEADRVVVEYKLKPDQEFAATFNAASLKKLLLEQIRKDTASAETLKSSGVEIKYLYLDSRGAKIGETTIVSADL